MFSRLSLATVYEPWQRVARLLTENINNLKGTSVPNSTYLS